MKKHKIDFIIGSVQKAGGTTSLDYYLRKHHQIGMAKKKELHFFDNDNIFSKPVVNYSKYENNFNFNSQKKYMVKLLQFIFIGNQVVNGYGNIIKT